VKKKLGHTGRRESEKCIFLVQDKMPPRAAKPQGLHMRWALAVILKKDRELINIPNED
jgi:hypothetical protein